MKKGSKGGKKPPAVQKPSAGMMNLKQAFMNRKSGKRGS